MKSGEAFIHAGIDRHGRIPDKKVGQAGWRYPVDIPFFTPVPPLTFIPYVSTSNPRLTKDISLVPVAETPLYNGKIPCRLREFALE